MRERPGFRTGAIAGYLIVGLLGGLIGGLLVGWMMRAGAPAASIVSSPAPYAAAPPPPRPTLNTALTQPVKQLARPLATTTTTPPPPPSSDTDLPKGFRPFSA